MDEFLMEIREHLEQSQQQYKRFYDTKHGDVEFAVGLWVWLRLLHHPIASLDVKGRGNLGLRFYGPFQVLERIRDVGYKLKLPAGAHLHDVFHVGLLKQLHGVPPSSATLPPIHHGRACLEPEAVTKGRLARGHQEVLVSWKERAASETSWMDLEEFQRMYLAFQLTDELCLQGGGERCHERHQVYQALQTESRARGSGSWRSQLRKIFWKLSMNKISLLANC
jgi:hypothetical protein